MKQRTGDILEEVKCGIILHSVNAQGVMGSGFAKALRARYPRVWEDYSNAIRPGEPDGGHRYLGRVIWSEVGPGLFVASIVGQQFYGRLQYRYTSYDALDAGLTEINTRLTLGLKPLTLADASNGYLLPRGLRSSELPNELHYPLLGCGLGGGDWNVVQELINTRLGEYDHTLWTLPE